MFFLRTPIFGGHILGGNLAFNYKFVLAKCCTKCLLPRAKISFFALSMI